MSSPRPGRAVEEVGAQCSVCVLIFLYHKNVGEGICVDPPLCRGTSKGTYGSKTIDLVCVGETVGKMGEVDETGERKLVLVVSVRCGTE